MSKDGLSLRHAKHLTKCIVCQKNKKGEKLSGDHSQIQYHLSCDKKYKLQAERRPSESSDGYDDDTKLEEEDKLVEGGVS